MEHDITRDEAEVADLESQGQGQAPRAKDLRARLNSNYRTLLTLINQRITALRTEMKGNPNAAPLEARIQKLEARARELNTKVN